MVILLTGATGHLGNLLAKKILSDNQNLIVLKRLKLNLKILKGKILKFLFMMYLIMIIQKYSIILII
jgi:short-subunit dehydrogenase